MKYDWINWLVLLAYLGLIAAVVVGGRLGYSPGHRLLTAFLGP